VIAYERTAHTERNAGFLRTQYRRWVARRTDAIACNGILSKRYCIEELRVPADRIVTGAMASDVAGLAQKVVAVSPVERASRRTRLGLSSPVFLYVGRLIRLKGLRELLQAWASYCSRETSPGTLLLVGDGPERALLETMIRERKLTGVVFAGGVPYDQIAGYFAVADVLVMPTLEDNWSLVVPEAMACGLPILCSRYNGCWPELVREGENGWVFDPCEERSFADALRRVRVHQQQLPALGQASRRIVSRFSPQSAAAAVLRACEIAMAATRMTPADGQSRGALRCA
jgi:glycosyltransferase involved in cell wall biosynthesis